MKKNTELYILFSSYPNETLFFLEIHSLYSKKKKDADVMVGNITFCYVDDLFIVMEIRFPHVGQQAAYCNSVNSFTIN